MITVNISPEMVGTDATDADVSKMVECLRKRGYNAHASNNPNKLDEEELKTLDSDWQTCLEQI